MIERKIHSTGTAKKVSVRINTGKDKQNKEDWFLERNNGVKLGRALEINPALSVLEYNSTVLPYLVYPQITDWRDIIETVYRTEPSDGSGPNNNKAVFSNGKWEKSKWLSVYVSPRKWVMNAALDWLTHGCIQSLEFIPQVQAGRPDICLIALKGSHNSRMYVSMVRISDADRAEFFLP